MALAVPSQIIESYRRMEAGTMQGTTVPDDWSPDGSTPGNRVDLLTDSLTPIKSWRKKDGDWIEGPAWSEDEDFYLWVPGMKNPPE
jgi:hypothetical protein